jgi:transposase-like protein
MKKRKGFVLRRIGTEVVIIGESSDLINFDHLVSLNPSAAYVWEALDSQIEFDVDTVAGLLAKHYDVDEETASKDAQELLNQWKQAEITED